MARPGGDRGDQPPAGQLAGTAARHFPAQAGNPAARGRRRSDVERWGLQLRLHPLDNGCEKNLLFTPQMYEPEERAALGREIARRAPGEPFVFVDIGANVGLFSLFVAAQAGPGAHRRDEPEPDNFARLTFNVTSNPPCRSGRRNWRCRRTRRTGDRAQPSRPRRYAGAAAGSAGAGTVRAVKTLLAALGDEHRRYRRAQDRRRRHGGRRAGAVLSRRAAVAVAAHDRH